MRGVLRKGVARRIRRRTVPLAIAFIRVPRCSIATPGRVNSPSAKPSMPRSTQPPIPPTTRPGLAVALYMANTTAPYGRSMNGNSFETDTITTYNGYQYTAYWKTVKVGGALDGELAIGRRTIGRPTGRRSRSSNTRILQRPRRRATILSPSALIRPTTRSS